MRGFIDGEYQDGEVRGRVFVCGQTGCGKTTEMLRLIGQCSGGAVFFDTTGRHEIRGAVIVHEPGELERALLARIGKGSEHFRVLYQPWGGDLIEHFRHACRIVELIASITFAIDEVDSFCGPEWGSSHVPAELYKLAHFGRHAGKYWRGKRRGVALLYTARIPTSVARVLSSQAYEMRLFHEHESSYLNYYAKGPLGKDNARKLLALRNYQFYIWKNDGKPMALAGGDHNGNKGNKAGNNF